MDYADIFEVLNENAVLSDRITRPLRDMATFRNRIVHIYWDIDLPMVHEIIRNDLGDIETYLVEIANYIVEKISLR